LRSEQSTVLASIQKLELELQPGMTRTVVTGIQKLEKIQLEK